MKTKEELQNKLSSLENEYDCMRMSWLFMCNEQEKISYILSDISEQLGLNIPNTYYKQLEAINILFDCFSDKFNIPKISDECKKELLEFEY